MDISVKNVNHLIKLSGTTNAPFFCGKDVCSVLEYKNPKDALTKLVDQKDKRTLNDLIEDGATLGTPNQKLSYNDGKAIFLSEQGLFSLLKNSESPVAPEALKVMPAALKDLKVEWLANEPMQDIFSFIVNHHQDLVTDMKAPWFQQWVRLSMVQFGFNHHGTTMDQVNHVVDENEVVCANAPESDEKGTTLWLDGEMQRGHQAPLDFLVVTEDLLDFLGYRYNDGRDPQKKFILLLTKNDIPFKLLTFEEGKDNKVIEREAERITPNNLKRKRWIMMTVESFKDAVMCLDTQRGREVRKYYRTIESLLAHYGSYQRSLLEAQRIVSTKKLTQEHQAQLALKDQSQKELQEQLALKDKSEAELQEQLNQKDEEINQKDEEVNHYKDKLRSETEKCRMIIKRSLEFHQATKPVEPREYIYVATTDHYQSSFKFKVGGVQSFELLKSRLSQYNSGKSDSDLHYFVFVRKTLNYKIIEQTLQSALGSFRETQDKELFFMSFKWLKTVLDHILDGNKDILDFINLNRMQMVQELHEAQPGLEPPVHLEEIKVIHTRVGEDPVVLTNTVDPDTVAFIVDAVRSFQPETNVVHRKDLERHFEDLRPDIFKKEKRVPMWNEAKKICRVFNPRWILKWN